MKKVLVINSAKGGVGKTEVTIGIAKRLADNGENVTIIDLDVTTPNIGRVTGVQTKSAGSNSMLNKKQIKRLIRESINKEDTDGWILIDTPPTISSMYSAITETIKNAKFLYVTTPSKNAVNDTKAGVQFFANRGVVSIGLIQNMVGEMFGDAIDSIDIMGVPTIGEIPLTSDTAPYFKSIVEHIIDIDFDSGYAEEDRKIILDSLSVHSAEHDRGLPLRFYNLEIWDIIRERILEKEFGYGRVSEHHTESHFNISTKHLKEIIDCGSSATIMVKGSVSVVNAPIPYEIREADIVYDNKVSKWLPMFQLSNGVQLWHHECFLVDDATVKSAMDSGGINVEEGRIIQSLFQTMYLNRAFACNGLDFEVKLAERHIQETNIRPSKKEIIYIVYKLEEKRCVEFDTFDWMEYMESNKAEYPEYYSHLVKLAELGEEN
jgi:ATP-binding protein involved in chromosome partitioning